MKTQLIKTFYKSAAATLLTLCLFVQSTNADSKTKSRFQFATFQANAKLAVDSLHRLQWDKAALAGNQQVSIESSNDQGTKWTTVATIENSGEYLWKVPNAVTDEYWLRLSPTKTRQAGEVVKFAIVPSQAVTNYTWKKVTLNASFAARDGAGALSYKNKLWLLGGWNPGDKVHFPRTCNNEVWNSADGTDWTLVKPNTFLDRKFDTTSDWEGRHTAGYAVYKDKMWIVGGDANQGNYQNDVWSSSDGKTWKLVNDDVPWGPRALHYTFVFKDKLWVLGGQTMPGFAKAPESFYRDVWNTTDGVTWDKVTPEEPYWVPRGMIGGNVVLHDRIWILGGGTYDTPTTKYRNFYNDVWSSADGINWTQHTAAAPWHRRQYHDVAAFDGRMWVLEGYASANRNDVWYSADGLNWYEVPNTPWKPRHAASVFVHDNALWMVAGNNMKPDVWKLQRISNQN